MGTDENLPDSFDVVICGTGLTESMVAASLSRIGKKVLHIDRNDYYGGHWATFNFKSLLEVLEACDQADGEETNFEVPMEIAIPKSNSRIDNVVVKASLLAKNEDLHETNEEPGLLEKNEKQVVEDLHETNEEPGLLKKNEELGVEDLHETNEEPVVKENKEETEIECQQEINDKLTVKDESVSTLDITPDTNLDESKEITTCIDTDCATNEQEIQNQEKEVSMKNIEQKYAKESTKIKNTSPSIVSQAKIKQGMKNITLEDFLILSRKFNLDISPKFLFSAGPLVQAIIKANIAHYAEFKLVNRILMCKDNEIVEVPCNRGDVFNSKFLTMLEKRVLMKFLTLCVELDLESDEFKHFIGKPFDEFLISKRLSDNLRKFVIYSIALVKPDTHTELALVETQSFLKSLGRFGKSPFIWPLFGVAELPQAFCRMCAVFGGLYCLRKDIKSISVDEDTYTCNKVIFDDQEINCKHIVMDNSYVPDKFRSTSEYSTVSKAILITNRSLSPSSEEQISFLSIPPLPGKDELVRVIEVGPASSACPSGLFVLYLSCLSTTTAIEDLQDYSNMLTCTIDQTDETKPNLLWAVYFNQVANISFSDYPKNMFITSMPGSSLGFGDAVAEAEKIFHSICPAEEFMLAVPNPEDIIWDHDVKEIENEKEEVELKQNKAEENNGNTTQNVTRNIDENIDSKDIENELKHEAKYDVENSKETKIVDETV